MLYKLFAEDFLIYEIPAEVGIFLVGPTDIPAGFGSVGHKGPPTREG